mgnify:CR=1 FL=1
MNLNCTEIKNMFSAMNEKGSAKVSTDEQETTTSLNKPVDGTTFEMKEGSNNICMTKIQMSR